MMKRLLFCLTLFVTIFSINNVYAGVLEDKLIFNSSISSIAGKSFDNINSFYSLSPGQAPTINSSLKFDLKDTTNISILPAEQTYYYLTINYCSTGNEAFYDVYSSYENQIFDIVNTGVSCKASPNTTGSTYIMFVQLKLSFFDDDDTGAYAYRLYFQPNFGIKNNDSYLFHIRFLDSRIMSYDNFLKVYQDYSAISNQVNIINKNQELIDKNQQMINEQSTTNKKLDNIDGTMKDSNVDSAEGTINGVSNNIASNGVITNLVTLPVSLFQKVLNSLNSTCSNYNMGSLLGTDIILPCIDVSNYLGNTIWSVIDVLISGLFVYSISRKMVKVFDNLSSLKEGDVLID